MSLAAETGQGDQHNPLVTFALFAYNQEKFIREAVEGALAQTYSPLEVILSDDCSTDRTFEIMHSMAVDYEGPHKIRLNRNPSNLGLIGHVNTVFELARGELIVAAAGDDVSLPHRTNRAVEVWLERNRAPWLLHSSVLAIDRDGADLGIRLPPIANGNMTIEDLAVATAIYIGATGVWSNKLYTQFGPIILRNAYEDLVLGFRAALAGDMYFIEEPLVLYRSGLGMATKTDLRPDSFKPWFRRYLLQNEVLIDVLKQRIEDATHPSLECRENVLACLKGDLAIRIARRHLYNSPVTAFCTCGSGGWLTLYSLGMQEFRSFGSVAFARGKALWRQLKLRR